MMKAPQFNKRQISLRESFLEALNEALSKQFKEQDIDIIKKKLSSN